MAPWSLIGALILAALLAVTALGGANARSSSQTLQLAVGASDVDYSDPALAYGVLSWQIEYETCAKLIDYSDVGGTASSELSPDAATAMPVISAGGKTYTFTIRPGIRFSDGAPLSAASFKAAFDRDTTASMNSPVSAFMADVVGWNAELNKQASTVSGVAVERQQADDQTDSADGGLVDKLGDAVLLRDRAFDDAYEPSGVLTLPGAGPYYIADRTVGKQLVLKENPYYKGSRPHRSDTIVITMNTDPQQTYLQVSNGTYAADPAGLDNPAAAADLQSKYGVNKSRFFVARDSRHRLRRTEHFAQHLCERSGT